MTTGNAKPTTNGLNIQIDPKTRRPILGNTASPKASPRGDFRATNAKLKGGPKNFIRRAGPRGG